MMSTVKMKMREKFNPSKQPHLPTEKDHYDDDDGKDINVDIHSM